MISNIDIGKVKGRRYKDVETGFIWICIFVHYFVVERLRNAPVIKITLLLILFMFIYSVSIL